MLNDRLMKWVGITSLALILTACSHRHSADEEAQLTGNEGAQTQGIDQEGDFHGWGSSTKEGANQSYYFSFDKSNVNPNDMASIAAQANYLKTHPSAHIRLEGNTDARGSREYNVALGYRRANSVAAILRMKGITSKQMTVISWGREKPVAIGDTEDAYRQNRRVDLVYDSK